MLPTASNTTSSIKHNKMKKQDVRYGQNIVHKDGTITKVHHVDDDNKVHFFAFMAKDNKGVPGLGDGMIVHNNDYSKVYGSVDEYRPSSPSESLKMERWIISKS